MPGSWGPWGPGSAAWSWDRGSRLRAPGSPPPWGRSRGRRWGGARETRGRGSPASLVPETRGPPSRPEGPPPSPPRWAVGDRGPGEREAPERPGLAGPGPQAQPALFRAGAGRFAPGPRVLCSSALRRPRCFFSRWGSCRPEGRSMKLLCVLAVVGSLLVPRPSQQVRRPAQPALPAPRRPGGGWKGCCPSPAPRRRAGRAAVGESLSGLGCRPLGRGSLQGPPLDLKRTRWSSSQGPVFGHVV